MASAESSCAGSKACAATAAEMRFTLDLGEIGLNPSEVLALAPGSTFQVERPAKLRGLLRCNGYAWAFVSIACEQQFMAVCIEEIAPQSGNFAAESAKHKAE